MRRNSLSSPKQGRKAEHLGLSDPGRLVQLDDVETTAGAQQGRKASQQFNFIHRHERVEGEIADDRIERLVRE